MMDERLLEIVVKNVIRSIYPLDEALKGHTIGDLKKKILSDSGLPEAELMVCEESFEAESKLSIPKDDVSFSEIENDLREEVGTGRVIKRLIFMTDNLDDRVAFLEVQLKRMVPLTQYENDMQQLKERTRQLEEENKMLRNQVRKFDEFYSGRMMDNQFYPRQTNYPLAFRPDGKENISRQKSKSVFIRNLAYKVSDEELRKFVSQFGFLESCYILRHGPRRLSSGKAKATFGSIEDAEKCVILMNGKLIGDRNVLVDFCQN